MNFEEKNIERKRIKSLFIASYPEGCIKITKGEGRIHAKVKGESAQWLKTNNWEFWSEPTLVGQKGRPDFVCLHQNGNSAFILEIVSSESEASIKLKEEKYPLPVKVIIAKDFKYEDFCF